jgi:nitrogenase molybdenum-cofactor synthesis protein NifE
MSLLEDIAQSAQARLNIVVSHTGLEAARYMEREHGIPYLVGILIGRELSRLYWNSDFDYLGEAAITLFQNPDLKK